MPRAQRNTITKNLISQVRRNIEQEIPLKRIGETLNLSYSTVKRIAKNLSKNENYERDFKTAYEKRRPKQTSETTKQLVAEMVNAQNEMTEREIVQELGILQVPTSQSTVSRIMKKTSYSRKRLSLVPVERNTPTIINIRRIYANAIALVPDENIIFLDEAGFSRHTQRHYGYSPVNVKAVKFVQGSRGQNKSLLAMIKKSGVVAHRMYEGAVNRTLLAEFLEDNLTTTPLGEPQPTLVMDNVKFHHSPETKEVCQRKRVLIKYLPAYSPHLNPIEQFFSIVKARFHSERSPKNTFLQIRECVDRAILTIEDLIYINLFREMRKWVEKARAGEMFF